LYICLGSVIWLNIGQIIVVIGLPDVVEELLEVLVNLGMISKIDLPDEAIKHSQMAESIPCFM